jgi:hypothetical protein
MTKTGRSDFFVQIRSNMVLDEEDINQLKNGDDVDARAAYCYFTCIPV